jgi:hypothetical protein
MAVAVSFEGAMASAFSAQPVLSLWPLHAVVVMPDHAAIRALWGRKAKNIMITNSRWI